MPHLFSYKRVWLFLLDIGGKYLHKKSAYSIIKSGVFFEYAFRRMKGRVYMKVNIYYGGRGLIGDPTLYIINKIQEVLQELRVSVGRYNLHEQKNGISMLPNTFKDADAVILAVNVEWCGIGA